MADAPPRWLRPVAASLGALGVLAGAFGAHALRDRVAPDLMNAWETAADYGLLHAAVLLSLSAWEPAFRSNRARLWLISACYLFLTGILLFSGSLFALVLTGVGGLGLITPFGGTALILAWILLVRTGLIRLDKDTGA